MRMRSLQYALIAWLWCLLASCSRSHSETGGDSSTHWLKRCGGDDQCGGLSCVCGVCSSECDRSHECSGLGPSAVCAAGTTLECGSAGSAAVRLCDATCQRDADCASGLACVEQRCRPAGAAPEPNASKDAGASVIRDGGGSTTEAGPAPAVPPVAAPLGASCAPQRAVSNGSECALSRGYAWNGAGCEEVVCGCNGADCGAIQPSKSACEAAFASCRPMSVCSGLPWYQCADYCPSHMVLRGGGRSFGECDGECSFELAISPITVLDVGSCTELMADLTIMNTDGSGRIVNITLSHAGWQQLALLSLGLEGAAFEPVTPCPTCPSDVGQRWVTRSTESGVDTKYYYSAPSPPPGLQAYDAFIQQLIDQGRACQGDLLERCGSYTPQPSPRCGAGLAINNTTCECSVPFAQLSTLKGTACSASCGSCQVRDSTCGATCIQPCDGGTPVWETYCSE